MITPTQSRMARAALRWSIEDLAERAGVGKNTALRFEDAEEGNPRRSSMQAIEAAFRKAGVEFIGETGVTFTPPKG